MRERQHHFYDRRLTTNLQPRSPSGGRGGRPEALDGLSDAPPRTDRRWRWILAGRIGNYLIELCLPDPQAGAGRFIVKDEFKIESVSNRCLIFQAPLFGVHRLHYADEVWWPLGDYLYSTGAGILDRPRDLISVEKWRGWIDESRDLLRLVPKGASTVTSESPSRKDLSDDRAEVTAQSQSMIFCNYIAYAGASIFAAEFRFMHNGWTKTGDVS